MADAVLSCMMEQWVRDTPEQRFREAYLSLKLWLAFKQGCSWAQTDLNGVEIALLPADVGDFISAEYCEVCGLWQLSAHHITCPSSCSCRASTCSALIRGQELPCEPLHTHRTSACVVHCGTGSHSWSWCHRHLMWWWRDMGSAMPRICGARWSWSGA